MTTTRLAWLLIGAGLAPPAALGQVPPSPSAPVLVDDAWYLAPTLSWIADDAARRTDGGPGARLGVGRLLSPHLAAEFAVAGAALRDDDARQVGASLELLALLDAGAARATPYLVVGAGYLATRYRAGGGRPASDDSGGLTLSAGAGGLVRLGAFPGRLRLEARLRNDRGAGDAITDVIVSAGLVLPIGRRPPARPPDRDGDGVLDPADRCPASPAGAIVDGAGCELDSDGDGITDRLDRCAGSARDSTVDRFGCAPDADRDGVTDADDACPGTGLGASVDNRGCPRDTDGDGIVDRADFCAETAPGGRVDFRGCAFAGVIALPGITFAADGTTLTARSATVLDGAAGTLRRYPELVVECAGHTDSRGTAAYNQALSARRAQAVCDALVERGIAPDRLSVRGYGESRPIADNATPAGRLANRRVDLRVIE